MARIPVPEHKTVTDIYYAEQVLPVVVNHYMATRPRTGVRGLKLLHDNAPAHCSKWKEFAKGAFFFPFREDLFLEGTKSSFNRIGKQHQEVQFDEAGNLHNEKKKCCASPTRPQRHKENQTYSLSRDLILKSYSLYAVCCEIFKIFYFQHNSILEFVLCLW